jgi:hypothetical protein
LNENENENENKNENTQKIENGNVKMVKIERKTQKVLPKDTSNHMKNITIHKQELPDST